MTEPQLAACDYDKNSATDTLARVAVFMYDLRAKRCLRQLPMFR